MKIMIAGAGGRGGKEVGADVEREPNKPLDLICPPATAGSSDTNIEHAYRNRTG